MEDIPNRSRMNYSTEDFNSTDSIGLNLMSWATTDVPVTIGISYKNFTEYRIALFLNTYYLACLCPVGLLLNSAAIVTILRLKPFNTSSLYITVLAAFDSLCLIAKLSYIELTRKDVDIGDAGCKILCFLGSFLDQFAIWILVLVTIERFVAVWLPLKVSCWFTMFRARLALVVTALALFLINIHILVIFRQVSDAKDTDCVFYPQYLFFITNIWYWIESCLTAIFPCIILGVLNILIIYRMRRAMEKQRQMITASDNPRTSKQNHKAHLTVMLVTVSVAFVFMVLPLAIFNVFRGTLDFQDSPYETARYFFTQEVTHFIADFNHVFNFIFYFLSSRRFRRMFYLTVRCRSPPPPVGYDGLTRTSYLKSNTSSTNTYYMHTSMRVNGGIQ